MNEEEGEISYCVLINGAFDVRVLRESVGGMFNSTPSVHSTSVLSMPSAARNRARDTSLNKT
jgi:hypothetical protein